MSTPATTWPGAPRNGLDALAYLTLSVTSAPGAPTARSGAALWALLHRAYPDAARRLARPNGAFLRSAHLRPEVDEAGARILIGRRHGHCIELLEAFGRALVNCPTALGALLAPAPENVTLPPRERFSLEVVVRRRLIILGCTADELAVRRLTGDILHELSDRLRDLPAETGTPPAPTR